MPVVTASGGRGEGEIPKFPIIIIIIIIIMEFI